MQLVSNITSIDQLISQFSVKGTCSNNYLLASTYEEYIKDGRLYLISGVSNAGLLVENEGFYRLYYYLNDFDEVFEGLPSEPVALEILYRGETKRPIAEMAYWEKNGFHQHLVRDNMMASYSHLTLPRLSATEVSITYTQNREEVAYVHALMQSSLDRYTGDQMSLEELEDAALNRNILLANWNGKMAGFLRFYLKNNVVWLGHIVVADEYRGKGTANELVRAFVLENHKGDDTRYQLWVIQDNIGAVRLYQKFGFKSANKSSASMLKL